jgi:hypothetical protein
MNHRGHLEATPGIASGMLKARHKSTHDYLLKKRAARLLSTSSSPGTEHICPLVDMRLYFVPCETEDEAAFLTGFLNAPIVAEGVSSYAAQLSLGRSVVEYLLVPLYDPRNESHCAMVELAKAITLAGGESTRGYARQLNGFAARMQAIPERVLSAAEAAAANEEVQAVERAAM